MSRFADELRSLVDDLAAAGGPGLWERLCELGLHRIGIEEERGGSGGSLDDLLVVVESLARHGIGVPLIEASTADWVLGHGRAEGRAPDGALATIHLLDHDDDPHDPHAPHDDDHDDHDSAAPDTVTAELPAVPWARDAARLVLCPPRRAPFVIDLGHPSVTIRPGENLAGEPRDTVVLTDTPAGTVDGAPSPPAVRERIALLWSAAVLGAAHGAYRLTRSYVVQRHQFGAPLIKIPAVAGNLARMRVHLVQADAALALAREAGPSGGAVDIARVTTAAAATEIARIAHQLHGAMGITAEYPLHHLTRRLWSWRDAVESERGWAERLGRLAAGAGETGVWTRITATGR
ncbi:acyl-CoA dehydrogenase family protein [Streptomyces yaizuensis]|uniref:Acyl-CoA dehydrogenase family protein n=1 Tax=Streptomyces yaizuensis TaxID=2989713 RepID=A0ABQ5NS85_9ACTN|nr:acyl-CoA dehydrogenase family protein [Streptomyces sp. YSPA8]GLF93237.1 acyl-CoA dehydrogenase family protein [Streptomyces sp. YSPA8]